MISIDRRTRRLFIAILLALGAFLLVEALVATFAPSSLEAFYGKAETFAFFGLLNVGGAIVFFLISKPKKSK